MVDVDSAHIWHPYNTVVNPTPNQLVRRAYGCTIELADGQRLVDGMSSWWSAIHGYNVPELNLALTSQLENMAHVMFGGLTHEPAIDLAQQLIEITAEPLEYVFYADSGSVAVEVAIKMALQYWFAQGVTDKNKLLTVRGGYHGDTFGAMAVCDPVNGMHTMFNGVLASHIFVEKPSCRYHETWADESIDNFHQHIQNNHQHIAAVILEPIVQGAGGMYFYHPEYLRQIRKLCNDYNVLLILDEIATGFGRTGKMFAYEHADITPDILCLGKAITGGYMSLAVTMATREVAHGISADGTGVLMHGPTFMANPLACRVATSSIELLMTSPWQQRVKKIEAQLREQLERCRKLPGVKNVRCLGAIGVIELDEQIDQAIMQRSFVEQSVWIRPFSNLVYIMPPYIITTEELEQLTSAIWHVLVHQDSVNRLNSPLLQ